MAIVFDFTQNIPIKPHFSKIFASLLSIMYGGAWLSLIPLTLPLWVRIVIALCIVLSAIRTIRLYVLYANPLYDAELQEDTLVLTTGQHAQLLDSYTHPLFVVLCAKLPTQHIYSLVIFPDAMDEALFHLLRVRLRYMIEGSSHS